MPTLQEDPIRTNRNSINTIMVDPEQNLNTYLLAHTSVVNTRMRQLGLDDITLTILYKRAL